MDNRPLSFIEEIELTQRVQQGEAEAEAALLQIYDPFLLSLMQPYLRRGVTLQELHEAAQQALLRAARQFDEKAKRRFPSYASRFIRQALIHVMHTQQHRLQIPVATVEMMRKLSQAAQKLHTELDRTPSAEELAAESGIPLEKVLAFLEAMQEAESKTAETFPVEVGIDPVLQDFTEDKPLSDIELIGDKMQEGLALMTPREADILCLKYGLSEPRLQTVDMVVDRAYSDPEIGDILSIRQERIRQVRAKFLRKIRVLKYGRKQIRSFE